MMKAVNFSARCPFCEQHHHHQEPVDANSLRGQAVPATHHFNCCGMEFGFSVRRLLLGDKIMEAGKP